MLDGSRLPREADRRAVSVHARDLLRKRTAHWVLPESNVPAEVRSDDLPALDPKLSDAGTAAERCGAHLACALSADGEPINLRRRRGRVPNRQVGAVPLHLSGSIDFLAHRDVRQGVSAMRQFGEVKVPARFVDTVDKKVAL